MSASINEFVDINVLVEAATPDRFNFGNYLGVFDHSVTANRIDGPYTSVAEVVAAGFTLLAEPEVYYWATSVFSQDDAVDAIYIGREDAGDANWTATMDAIEAYAVANGLDWYGTTIESRVKADIALVAAWIEARRKIFLYQSADSDVLTGAAGNINDVTKVAGYKRSFGVYHATSAGAANGYLDGAWASSGLGMNLDAPGGRGIWAYRTLEGITYDAVTSAQASNIYADNGNIYGRNLGLSFTSKGTMAAGVPYFVDVQTTIDWVKTRLEEDILAYFVSQNVVPYTNAGINGIRGVIKNRLDIGITNGHFSPDFTPVVNLPNVEDVSSANKAARLLQGSASAVFAGGIQKLDLLLNLSF